RILRKSELHEATENLALSDEEISDLLSEEQAPSH
ncbi:MAG: hypothetical protein ACI87W_002777, partial [Halieaceae bacterium]